MHTHIIHAVQRSPRARLQNAFLAILVTPCRLSEDLPAHKHEHKRIIDKRIIDKRQVKGGKTEEKDEGKVGKKEGRRRIG